MYYTRPISTTGTSEAAGECAYRGRAGDEKSGHITGFGRYFEAVVKRRKVRMYAVNSKPVS